VLGGRIVASRQKHVESRDYLVEGSSQKPALRNSTDLIGVMLLSATPVTSRSSYARAMFLAAFMPG